MTSFLKKTSILTMAVTLLAYVHVGRAHASTIYTYTGNNYNDISNQSSPNGAFTTSMKLTGFLEFAGPLAADLSFTNLLGSPQLLDFSFNTGRNILTPSNIGSSTDNIRLTTDASGDISVWTISLANRNFDSSVQVGDFIFSLKTNLGFDDSRLSLCVFKSFTCFFGTDSGIIRSNPGAWVTTGDLLLTTVPVPAALPLFGTGLALMGFIGWRRKRKAVGGR